MNSATAFMIALMLLIGALVIGSLTFLNQMNTHHILINSGNQPIKHVLNHYKYRQSKRGFIYSVSFLIASACVLIMVALPTDERKVIAKPKPTPQPAPTPMDRKDSSISAIIEPAKEEKAPEPEAPIAAAPPPADKEEPPAIEVIEPVEEIHAEYDEVTEGEDDVVYGNGPISDAAIMHFVHRFPDSALKFLYRKQLDGKALTNVEDNIYQEWENRQLTRGKVKGYILSLMDWKEFPKKPLYETWKEIRDHIFENVD